jgi:presenilin-like A22 family membrane protease
MIAFGSFLPEWLTIVLTLIAVFFKVIRPNVIVHNISEIFVYAGIAAIFVPLLNMFSAFMLLVLISAYDAYAVWKSKHMIKLAKFQSKSKLFAGLTVPYSFKKKSDPKELSEKKVTKKKVKVEAELIPKKKDGPRVAILGGGDIAFPLLFTGAVMQELIMSGLSPTMAIFKSLIITLFVTGSVAYLFFYGKKDRFYPAMPYISIGCLLGYGLVLIL